jgi:hypothetical protein
MNTPCLIGICRTVVTLDTTRVVSAHSLSEASNTLWAPRRENRVKVLAVLVDFWTEIAVQVVYSIL